MCLIINNQSPWTTEHIVKNGSRPTNLGTFANSARTSLFTIVNKCIFMAKVRYDITVESSRVIIVNWELATSGENNHSAFQKWSFYGLNNVTQYYYVWLVDISLLCPPPTNLHMRIRELSDEDETYLIILIIVSSDSSPGDYKERLGRESFSRAEQSVYIQSCLL